MAMRLLYAGPAAIGLAIVLSTGDATALDQVEGTGDPAADRPPASTSTHLRGELVNKAGPEWEIRDEGGHEIRMQMDERLMQRGDRPRIGEQVEISLDAEGRATSVRRLSGHESNR